VPLVERPRHRGRAVEGVLEVHVGAALDEEFDDLGVAALGGLEERGRAVAELGVHVRPAVEHRLDLGHVALARGLVELFVERLLRVLRRRPRREREQEQRRQGVALERHGLHSVFSLRPPWC
jgi:hypothetical protein